MSLFAEALDNRANSKSCWSKLHHTPKGSTLMNYRLSPSTGPYLLNLTALLELAVSSLPKRLREEKKYLIMKRVHILNDSGTTFLPSNTPIALPQCRYRAHYDQLRFLIAGAELKQAHLHVSAWGDQSANSRLGCRKLRKRDELLRRWPL